MATLYIMRALKTSTPSKYVYWTSTGSADMTGQYSGYSPSELTSITVDYTRSTLFVPAENVSVTGIAGGDLLGTYPNPTVTGLQGRPIENVAPLDGQVLGWVDADGYWKPVNSSGSGTPGGLDTYVQFNDGGTLGGDSGLTYNKTTNVLSLSDSLATGSAPASTGTIRLSHGDSIKSRNESNGSDLDILSVSNVTDVLNIWGTSGTHGHAYFNIGGSATLTLRTSGTDVAIFGRTASDFISLNTIPATNGTIRLPADTTIKARNVGDTANIMLMHVDTNKLYIGSNADATAEPASEVGIYPTSHVYLGNNGNTGVRVTGTALTLWDAYFETHFNATADAGTIRMRNTDSIQFRNNADGGNVILAVKDANDYVYIGSDAALTGSRAVSVFMIPQTSTFIGGGGNAALKADVAGTYAVNNLPFHLKDLQINNPTATDFGGGVGVIGITDASTVPTTNPTGGVILYSEGGALKFRNPAGTITTIGAGGGTPGGSDTHVQFNDGGVFGGEAGLSYNKTTDVLSVATAIALGTNASSSGAVRLANDESIAARNAANSSNFNIIKLDSFNNIIVGDGGAGNSYIQVSTGSAQIDNFVWDGASFVNALSLNPTDITIKTISTIQDGNADGSVTDVVRSVATTNATVTNIYTWTIANNAVTTVDVVINACTDDFTVGGVWKRSYTFRNNAGTVTAIGALYDAQTDEEAATWDVTIDNSTTTGRVRVTGEAGVNITWYGAIRTQTVNG